MSNSIQRREVLKYGLAATTLLGAGFLFPGRGHAAWTRTSLEECLSMTPEQMAKASGEVSASWNYLLGMAGEIRNPLIRSKVMDILNNPSPRLAAVCDQDKAAAELKTAGLLGEKKNLLPAFRKADKSLQPFWSAPGSGWTSHHAYPGGLVTHTALNVRLSAAIHEYYEKTFNFALDRDVVLAAQLLHDLHKPWVFQWQKDASSRTEETLAGTGEHHILSIAESLNQGLPAEVVVAQACAHDHPGSAKSEESVVNWLRAACILVGKDPIATGVLAPDGKTLPLPRQMEGFVTHLGDHDWVLSVPAAQWLVPLLKQLASERYGLRGQDLEGAKFNAFRNYIFSQASIMRLYHIYATQGEQGLITAVAAIVTA